MSFSSGVFTLTSGNPVSTGTTISSTWANNTLSDIATGLSSCVLKDGTQTITANIPMSSYLFTGLGAGSASGHSLRYEQVNGVVTTAGDMLYASGAGAFSRLAIGAAGALAMVNAGATAPSWLALGTAGASLEVNAGATAAAWLPAAATVAAHATTCDPWNARVVTLSGAAVTFTDLADADYVGQRVLLIMNAAHVWTDGAVFDVQGGATYTCAAGDWVEIVATAVDAFDVTIIPALGQPVAMQPITNSLASDVAMNNTANYFAGPAVAQGTAGKWFVSGTVTAYDTAGAANFHAKLWDGTTVIASAGANSAGSNALVSISLSGYISAPAGNLRIDVRDATSTSGVLAHDVTAVNNTDCTITAFRIA